MHITDTLDRFLVQLQADGRSPHTIGQYRRHLRLLLAWLAGEHLPQEVATLTHEILARFLASPAARLRPDGKAKRATSANCLRSSIRTFGAYLRDAGIVRTNPASVIKRAMCAPPPPRSMSQDDQDRLLATLAAGTGTEATRDRVMFTLMLRTGIRLGSAIGLEAQDLDLDRGELLLRRSKGDRPDLVVIPDVLVPILREYLDAHPVGYLFAGKDGRPLSSRHVQRRFREWCVKALITRKVSTHSLRHSFAQTIYAKTGDLLLLKAALHHHSLSSTLVYVHVDGDRLRKALA